MIFLLTTTTKFQKTYYKFQYSEIVDTCKTKMINNNNAIKKEKQGYNQLLNIPHKVVKRMYKRKNEKFEFFLNSNKFDKIFSD